MTRLRAPSTQLTTARWGTATARQAAPPARTVKAPLDVVTFVSVATAMAFVTLSAGCRRSEPQAESGAPAVGATTEAPVTRQEGEGASSPALPPRAVAPPTAPVVRAVVDRLRVGDASSVSIGRGGAAIAVGIGSRQLQVFDGARGRLLVERLARDEVICGERPTTPDGSKALWMRSGAQGPEVALIDLLSGETTMSAPIPAGDSPQCAMSLDGTAAVVATTRSAVVLSVPSGRVEVSVPLSLDGAGAAPGGADGLGAELARVDRILVEELGAAFVVAGRDRSGRVRVLAWGGEGGSRVRSLGGIVDIAGATLSPTGALLAVPSGHGSVVVRSVWTGDEVTRLPGDIAVGFASSDASLIVATHLGRTTRYGLVSREVEEQFDAIGVAGGADAGHAAALWTTSEDGQRLVVAADDGSNHRLVHYGREGGARFDRRQPIEMIMGLGYDARGDLLIVADSRRVTVDHTTGQPTAGVPPKPWLDLGRTFFESQLHRGVLRVGYYDEDVVVLDDEAGRLLLSRRVAGGVRSACITESKRLALVGVTSGLLVVGLDGTIVPLVARAAPEGSGAPAFDPGDVAFAAPAGADALWTISAAGTFCRVPLAGEPRCVSLPRLGAGVQVAASQSGDTAVVHGGATAVLIDGASLRERSRVRVGPAVALAVADDGKRFAVSDGTDVATFGADGVERARVVFVPGGVVTVSPDGRHGRPEQVGGYLRFREGFEPLDSDQKRLEALIAEWSGAPVPL